jgi:hypothetical protein
MMTVVAVAALASLAGATVCRTPSDYAHVDTLVACIVAGTFGLGAMRWPLAFFAPVFVTYVGAPRASEYAPHVIEFFRMSIGACWLGWIIGAPAGWVSRRITRVGDSQPVAPNEWGMKPGE